MATSCGKFPSLQRTPFSRHVGQIVPRSVSLGMSICGEPPIAQYLGAAMGSPAPTANGGQQHGRWTLAVPGLLGGQASIWRVTVMEKVILAAAFSLELF